MLIDPHVFVICKLIIFGDTFNIGQQSFMDILMKSHPDLNQGQSKLLVQQNLDKATSTSNNTDITCCPDYSCPNPCYPMMYPIPPPPVVIPVRTVFEPVIHHHPPLHVIKKIIKADKRRWKKYSSSVEYSSSDTETSGSDSYTDY